MAAVAASLLCHLKAGDHVVSARALFGSCRYIVEDLLPRFGIATTLVDGRDLDAWEKAVQAQHPRLVLRDADQPGARAGRYRGRGEDRARRPARWSWSTTCSPRRCCSGRCSSAPTSWSIPPPSISTARDAASAAWCWARKEFIEEKLHNYLKHTGPSLSPFNAWVLLKGLETLPVRVERAVRLGRGRSPISSRRARTWRACFYPGRADHPQAALAKRQMAAGGPMVAFEVKGGKDAAFRFMNALQIIKISNNLGDAKSLVTHPATTTHQRLTPEARAELGIFDNSVRLSVGLEDAGDLMADLDQALAAAK